LSVRPLDVVYGISFAFHVAILGVLQLVKEKGPEEVVAVELATVEKPKPKEEEKELEPEPVPAPRPVAKPQAPTPEAAPPAPDFGFVMASSGPGGPGGIAVPTGAQPTAPVQHKVLSAAPEGCADPMVKAKSLTMPHPAYTDDARAAAIEGKVRVELTVAADGTVSEAKSIEGLGHGLDEAAVAALRDAKFNPATKCGKAVASTFVVAVRFAL
jgi:protein TonB